MQHNATHCNTLQHTAAHCSTLQHTAAHCSTLQHTAKHCNTLQHTAKHCNTLQHIHNKNPIWILLYVSRDSLTTASLFNTIQQTATHCNTLQHTATHTATMHDKNPTWMDSYSWRDWFKYVTWLVNILTTSASAVRRNLDKYDVLRIWDSLVSRGVWGCVPCIIEGVWIWLLCPWFEMMFWGS